MITTRKSFFFAVVLLSCLVLATEYFLDPNNEYIYATLEGFEAVYDEGDQSLSVINETMNIFLNIIKLTEPVEGLELEMLTEEIQKNLEASGFRILSIDERDFQGYRATTYETFAVQDNTAVRVEFLIFEVPNRGFYMILSAAPDESYDDLRMLISSAKQMIMFME